MKDKILAAIWKMKSDKSTGPDSILVELLEALKAYGINKVPILLNKLYDAGQIPLDISKYILHCQKTKGNRLCLFLQS